jgi:hypothetical protein
MEVSSFQDSRSTASAKRLKREALRLITTVTSFNQWPGRQRVVAGRDTAPQHHGHVAHPLLQQPGRGRIAGTVRDTARQHHACVALGGRPRTTRDIQDKKGRGFLKPGVPLSGEYMYGSEHDTPLLLSLHPRERHGRHLRSDMRSVQLLRT